jgi:uncharacterized protein (DUF2236 family)
VKRFQVESGISLMPRWAQKMTGFDRPEPVQRMLHQRSMDAYARLLRWAVGTPPWVALARERVGTEVDSTAPARLQPVAAI